MKPEFPNEEYFISLANTAIQPCRYIPPRDIENFVDLRLFADDAKILKNPHKGWYWHYIDNGFPRGEYRADCDENDALADFPCMNHLYLRFDWGDIEREDGVFDWSYIDSVIEKWGARGFNFALRICTYEGYDSIRFATPRFVFEKGAHCYRVPCGRLEPDYTDPVYLFYLERFLAEAGRKFAGKKYIETVDVGSFGTWGEGHTAGGTNIKYGADAIIKHIKLHEKYFPKTILMLNDDMINSCWERGADENMRIWKYAIEHKMGLDDDSVCVSCYCGKESKYTTLRSPWMFAPIAENAPITLELEHYHMIKPQNFRAGLPFLEAMRETGATFAGFHGYPRVWLADNPYLTEYAANRLGYFYFLSGVGFEKSEGGLPMLERGKENTLSLYVENRGFARAYFPYKLKIRLTKSGYEHVCEADSGNIAWLAGRETKADIGFVPVGDAGEYSLSLGLFEDERPVYFAMKEERQSADGFVHVGMVEVR